jgi:hypothetical protein
MRAEALATLDALERAWAARLSGVSATPHRRRAGKALLARIRCQRARLLQTV